MDKELQRKIDGQFNDREAVDFLGLMFPGMPVKVLAKINPPPRRGSPFVAATYGTHEPAVAMAKAQNRLDQAIYFQPNETKPEKSQTKASYADVTHVRALWVDIDCGAKNVEATIAKANDLVAQGIIPPPTVIVESGNGIWLWYALQDKTDDKETAKEINQALFRLFSEGGGDNCADPCWIARLPGTVNNKPGKGMKLAKMRRTAKRGGEPRYSLADFQPLLDQIADLVPDEKKPLGPDDDDGWFCPPPAMVDNFDDLKLDGSDLLRWVLLTGHKPQFIREHLENLPKTEPTDNWFDPETGEVRPISPEEADALDQAEFPVPIKSVDDRSGAALYAACEMWRRGFDAAKIAGVFLNPKWRIHHHIATQKNVEHYARRQVARARLFVLREEADKAVKREAALQADKPPTSPGLALEWMNHRHFVLEIDGKECVVASQMPSDLAPERTEMKVQSFTALRQRYSNRRVEVRDDDGNVKLVPLGDFWLGSAGRRQYLRVMFRPGGDPTVQGCYNLWQGFGIAPEPGAWPLMRAHISEVLADGDAVAEAYILRWAAYSVQNLTGPQGVILAFRGGKGSGKGTFARTLTEMFGQHGLHIASSDLLTGRFTGHLEDCCLLFADEAIHPGDREAESRLKGLVTEPVLTLEAKGRDARPARNHLKIVMASNEEWVAPASWDERRYAVFDVSPVRSGDKAYFDALNRELEDGGKAAMLFDLLHMDLGDWRPGDTIPETQALRSQKDLSLSSDEAWLLNILESGEIPGEWPDAFAPYCRPSKLRLGDGGLFEDMRRAGRDLNAATDQKLGRFLGRWLDRYTTGTARGWRFPPLAEMRTKWEAKHGPREWHQGVEEWPHESWNRMEEAHRDLPI